MCLLCYISLFLTKERSSATNCARVYNLSIGDYTCSRQHTYGLSNTEMTSDHVWDAFFIYGLILEASRSDERLSLPNKDTQHHDRYAAALQLRNNKYQGPSRPGWNHCCNLCARIVNRAEGRGKWSIPILSTLILILLQYLYDRWLLTV